MYDGLRTGAPTGVCASMYGLTYGCTYAHRRQLFSPHTICAVLYMCVHGPHFACLP